MRRSLRACIFAAFLVPSAPDYLLDLRAIGGTFVPGGARTTDSDGGLSVGLQLLQQHADKLDNDQIIASELRQLQSPRATTCTIQVPA
jgi:hypothetical protein